MSAQRKAHTMLLGIAPAAARGDLAEVSLLHWEAGTATGASGWGATGAAAGPVGQRPLPLALHSLQAVEPQLQC